QFVITDTHLQAIQERRYTDSKTFAIDDIYQVEHTACQVELLEQSEAKAYVIAPIFQGEQLWGLLATFQNTGPRHWEVGEVNVLAQIGIQLGVALQQAELLEQTRQQKEELNQAFQELRQSQIHLIQSEKMAGLGQLVAGVAHEINNPVNFIYGNLMHVNDYTRDLLSLVSAYQQHYPNPIAALQEWAEAIDLDFIIEDLPKTVASMRIGAERIRHMVLSLRNFSRLDEAQMKPVDIHEGIDSTLVILQHRLKACAARPAIEVIKAYSDLPPIECHAAQLNQVFMNLLSNSIDALEEISDQAQVENGEIIDLLLQIQIQTEVVGKNVVIRIADNGPGIPDALKANIFNPFFTTKGPGKGTGLGLSISYQIVVEKHKGLLKCSSQPEQGTEFRVTIPIEQADYQ
ncbi:MAG: GAF domain-containing sensor histidine kinase, partial [Cyanothece sp. SIO1E1]|nr:GAF domain-containing sensor histidine kinase [Cyanothece sp. SIO1E1]